MEYIYLVFKIYEIFQALFLYKGDIFATPWIKEGGQKILLMVLMF